MSSMYTLTDMTGRGASESRMVVIGTMEFNWRVWVVLGVGFVPAALFTMMTYLAVGVWAVIAFPTCEALALALFVYRPETGMRLRLWQSIRDRKMATGRLGTQPKVGDFALCGQVVDPDLGEWAVVIPSSIPVPDAAARFERASTTLASSSLAQAPESAKADASADQWWASA